MITKATKSKVTTTPMRIPKTGVNSNGTGDSEKGKKNKCKVEKYIHTVVSFLLANTSK